MVSIQTMEKKPRRIYFVLLALLAFLIPLGIYEVYNKQYLYFALEAVAFAFGVSYAVRFKRAFPIIELYREHLTLVRGTVRKEVPYDAIGTVEEMSNFGNHIYQSEGTVPDSQQPLSGHAERRYKADGQYSRRRNQKAHR